MSIDNIVMVLTFLSSVTALYFATKKQKHDEAKIDADAANLDADTIGKLYDLIEKQEARYSTLKNEFDQYKITTTAQISDIAGENVKLRRWIKRLILQLEQAGILPAKPED